MCRALLDGDPDAAAAACREHLTQTVNTIFDALLAGSRASIDLGG